jgi:hypothetical protein
MSALEVLEDLLQAGIGVLPTADGWALRGEPQAIAAFSAQALSVLRSELVWRRVAMAPSVPAVGAVPILVALRGQAAAGCCRSCGEPQKPGTAKTLRCLLCSVAARAAIVDCRRRAESPGRPIAAV